MRIYRKEGFTLVELLVVIAIIGILAGLMFPAITGAIEQANSTKIANNGKNIAQGIMAENMQREANNEGTIWPGDEATLYDDEDNEFTLSGDEGNAAKYFDTLIDSKTVETITSYGMFSGAGVPTPTGDNKLESSGSNPPNVWSCIAVKNTSVQGDVPFIYTRNLKPTTDKLGTDGKTVEMQRWSKEDYWNMNTKPFPGSRCVVVTRGAAVSQIRKRDMTSQRFWGDAVYGDKSKVEPWPAQSGLQ